MVRSSMGCSEVEPAMEMWGCPWIEGPAKIGPKNHRCDGASWQSARMAEERFLGCQGLLAGYSILAARWVGSGFRIMVSLFM
jgi:hypothetical protein